MEDTIRKTFWRTIQRTNHSVWFIGWVSPYLCERPVKNPSIWKESLTWIVPWIRSVRGWNLEWWHDGCRHWRVGNDGRIRNLLKKTQCKGSNVSKENGQFIFPVADGRIKFIGGDQELRTSTLIRDHQFKENVEEIFLQDQEGSLLPPQYSLPDAGEAINDFWSMSGNFIYRHHIEPRVKLYSPREESFPIPLKYFDVSRTTHSNLDVMRESRIDDYWNIDGSRDLSDYWTGFNQFTLLFENPPDGFLWSGWRLTKRQATSRPDHLWPELWTTLVRNAKLREKQKWAIEKPKLDNARRLRGIYFTDPEDKEFKENIRNAREIGNTNGSRRALQDMQEEKQVWRDPWHD